MATDYDRLAEAARAVLVSRLGEGEQGKRFAILCLAALIKDGKLAELLTPADSKA
jgi:hypothetical protein